MSKVKEYYKLTKKGAHQFIKVWTDDPEQWFIEISKCKNKTGEIVSSELIIKKDLDGFIQHLKRQGWNIEN